MAIPMASRVKPPVSIVNQHADRRCKTGYSEKASTISMVSAIRGKNVAGTAQEDKPAYGKFCEPNSSFVSSFVSFASFVSFPS